MLDISTFAEIVTIAGPIGWATIWVGKRIYKRIKTPTIFWGLVDCPAPASAHYYIYAKSSSLLKLHVQIKLRSIILQPTDYLVKVTKFYTPIGCENDWTIESSQRIERGIKIVEFETDKNVRYRIIIEAGGGRVGTLLPDNFDLLIACSNAKIRYKA